MDPSGTARPVVSQVSPPNLCWICLSEKVPPAQCEHGARELAAHAVLEGQLPPGTVLRDRYWVGRSLGRGGFSITYLAWDSQLHRPRAIKEYFPAGVVTRDATRKEVGIVTGQSELYSDGIQKYLAEARLLARFEADPCIVSPLDFFEENRTAYLVMEYLEGETLRSYVTRQGGRIPFDHARYFLAPVLRALATLHEAGILHRDVSPDNVFLTAQGQSKLLDFGAARARRSDAAAAMTIILRDRYAPPEQYTQSGAQGAWTDVYAAAATFYFAITGESPPSALERLLHDHLEPPSALGAAIPPLAEDAILRSLALRAEQRPQRIEDLFSALIADWAPPAERPVLEIPTPSGADRDEPDRGREVRPARGASRARYALRGAWTAALVAAATAGAIFVLERPQGAPDETPAPAAVLSRGSSDGAESPASEALRDGIESLEAMTARPPDHPEPSPFGDDSTAPPAAEPESMPIPAAPPGASPLEPAAVEASSAAAPAADTTAAEPSAIEPSAFESARAEADAAPQVGAASAAAQATTPPAVEAASAAVEATTPPAVEAASAAVEATTPPAVEAASAAVEATLTPQVGAASADAADVTPPRAPGEPAKSAGADAYAAASSAQPAAAAAQPPAAPALAETRRRSTPEKSARRSAELAIVSNVAGAELIVDGESRGILREGPYSLPAGVHRVVVRKPGYEEFAEPVELRAEAPAATLYAALKPLSPSAGGTRQPRTLGSGTAGLASAYQESLRRLASRQRGEQRSGLELLEGAAQAGLPEALEKLAAVYASGLPGVAAPDDQKALEWARKAAARPELAGAQAALAHRLELGRWPGAGPAAPRPAGTACRLLRFGCPKPEAAPNPEPDPETDFNAWLARQSPGRGAPEDLAEAFALYGRLARQNAPEAAERLGYMLLAGRGTEPNRFEAFRWFLRAARMDRPSAQYVVGKLYLLGEGYAASEKAGRCWLAAAASRNENARRALERLRGAAPAAAPSPAASRCDYPPYD